VQPAEFSDQTFTHVLIGDVVAAEARLKVTDSQTHRRELIRTVFAAIEGLHWQLKQDVLRHASSVTKLSAHEYAALQEEAYSVDANGSVRSQPRLLPLPTAIRLVTAMVQRYRPGYAVDFQHLGWSNLRASVETRNRLVHPKSLEELSVSDHELDQALSAFRWLLALVIEVLRETHENLKQIAQANIPKPEPSGEE
jgi:hypothetical protein